MRNLNNNGTDGRNNGDKTNDDSNRKDQSVRVMAILIMIDIL
jgi:hypothetical protein